MSAIPASFARTRTDPIDEASLARSWCIEQTGEEPSVLRVSQAYVARLGQYLGCGEAGALLSIHHRRLTVQGMRVELGGLPDGMDVLAVRS